MGKSWVDEAAVKSGDPVGWSIVAIYHNGSILCESPSGHRRRYDLCFQLETENERLKAENAAMREALLTLTPKRWLMTIGQTRTQGVMSSAVYNHPDKPLSAHGEWSGYLSVECQKHCELQGRIGMGHHNFTERYRQYVAEYPGYGFGEIVAWNMASDLEGAARLMADQWRSSPGHWAMMKKQSTIFAYDILRNEDGRWYGTGLFGWM